MAKEKNAPQATNTGEQSNEELNNTPKAPNKSKALPANTFEYDGTVYQLIAKAFILGHSRISDEMVLAKTELQERVVKAIAYDKDGNRIPEENLRSSILKVYYP